LFAAAEGREEGEEAQEQGEEEEVGQRGSVAE